MPVLFSDHLPIPSLKSYIVLSIIFLVFGFLYSRDTSSSIDGMSGYDTKSHSSNNLDSLFGKETTFTWSLVNLAYCGLFIFGKLIQRVVFGDLRLTEQQHIQEKFWNFVFYKFIFVFGVINAQTLNEVMHWIAWFSMVGFWKLFGQLCFDRFDFILSSPNLSRKPHPRFLLLLVAILMSSICMSFAAYYSDFAKNLNIFAFMLAECILLGLECLHMVTNYGIHFNGDDNWELKNTRIYYADFTFQVIIHGTNLIHHFHMLVWSNVFLSMASLVLYWSIRAIFSDLTRNIKKHKLFKRVTQSVEEKLELLEEDDLSDFEDKCAICWDSMKTARKLPCGHIFHQSCLCSWLQQDTSCPTCRISLANVINLPERQNHMTDGLIDQRQFADAQTIGNQRNHFFHFDGTRIANWFPSFSIEVFHGGNESSDIEFEQMAVQLHSMFPTIPYNVILDDVRRTQSPEATAENILEGNILCPIDEDEQDTVDQPYMQLDERPLLSNEEISSQELSADVVMENTAPSESESSDTSSSCVEFHDNSEKRHTAFQNKRRRMLTGARRRFTGKSTENHGVNCNQTTAQP